MRVQWQCHRSLTVSLIIVEDPVESFGNLIVSCWNNSSRISILTSDSSTLDDCLSLAVRAFEGQYGGKPSYASIHKIASLNTSQSLGVSLD